MAMPAHYTYTIEPIEGREFIQRNFATLPLKAAKYGNRAVSLNERFSVIERGYLLLPELKDKRSEFRKDVKLVFTSKSATPLKEQNLQDTVAPVAKRVK